MWTFLERGKCTAESISAAPCAALECGLKQSNLRHIASDLILHAFSFLDAIDYICNVTLVCREWSITPNDILATKQTAKFKLLKDILYNSFQLKLNYKSKCDLNPSKTDLLYEMETSISFALFNTIPYVRGSMENDFFLFERYPAQTLYFAANKEQRRFSYIYLLHYVYLYGLGPRSWICLERMYILLARVVFTGSILCVGYMMQLIYDKYGTKEDEFYERFWIILRLMFFEFYLHHHEHIQHKPICVLHETVYSFVKVLSTMSLRWNLEKTWVKIWPLKFPDNSLNHIIEEAHNKLCSESQTDLLSILININFSRV
eukprot:622205_1